MTTRRSFLIGATRVAGGLAIAACAPGAVQAPATASASVAATAGPRRGGTWVAVVGADPTSLEANLGSGVNRPASGVYNSLVTWNEKNEPIPDLAQSFTISPDGKRYEFKLWPTAKWHDGQPVTSADVKYTVEEVAIKYIPSSAAILKSIDRIETPDANTIAFVLKAPSAVFMLALGAGIFTVLPMHIYQNTDPRTNPRNSNPIGSGPFKFKEWVKGDHLTIVRNESYFKPGLPYLDQFSTRIIPDASARVIAFQKGDIDYIDGQFIARELVPELRKVAGAQVNEVAGTPGNELLFFNVTKKPFDDVRVRTALAHAINQQDVVDKAYFGVAARVAKSHIMQALTQYHDSSIKLPAYDVARANQLLDEAGLRRGADGTRLQTTISFNNTVATTRASATIVQDSLKSVGVNVELKGADQATTARVYTDKNVDMVIANLNSRGDPALNMITWYTTAGIDVAAGNAARYSNPELDKAMADGAAVADTAARRTHYVKMQAILARDLPAFPIADYAQVDFARPEVGGVFQAAYFYYRPEVLYRKQ